MSDLTNRVAELERQIASLQERREAMEFIHAGETAVKESMKTFDDTHLAQRIVDLVQSRLTDAHHVALMRQGRDDRATPPAQYDPHTRPPAVLVEIWHDEGVERFTPLDASTVPGLAYVSGRPVRQNHRAGYPLGLSKITREPYFVLDVQQTGGVSDKLHDQLTLFTEKVGDLYGYMDRFTRDALTGMFARDRFDFKYDAALRSLRQDQDLSFIMVDGNDVKTVNDGLGHSAGDHFIQAIAVGIRESLGRHDDFAGRTGGDEFSIVLPYTDNDGTSHFVTELRQRIEQSVRVASASHKLGLSNKAPVAIGYGSLRPHLQAGGTLATLRDVVDRKMYEDKALTKAS